MHTMSLRLDDADSARLREVAEATQLGNNDVMRAALREYHDRHAHRSRVETAIRQHLAEDADVLRRLAEA